MQCGTRLKRPISPLTSYRTQRELPATSVVHHVDWRARPFTAPNISKRCRKKLILKNPETESKQVVKNSTRNAKQPLTKQFLWLVSVLKGKTLQGEPGYGRNLLIKALPAIEDYQSNVYEVFMQPYFYDLGQSIYPITPGSRAEKQIDLSFGPRSVPGLQAIVHLIPDEESGVSGDLVFTQIIPNGPVTIEGNVTGLAPGLHGVHVHQAGAVKDNCKDIGPHFIAFYGRHGGPRDNIRHVGDLGNIKAEEGSPVTVKIVDHLISLTGPRSIVGRSFAISKAEDDYGRSSTEDSALTGTSGPAVACGIIGYLN